VVCFSSLSKGRDMNMSIAVDRKRRAAMIRHEENQHRALRMLASNNNNQADRERSHAMSTAQDTVLQ